LLNDLFGAHYQGTAMGSGKREAIDVNFEKAIDPMYWEKRKGIFDFKLTKHPIFDSQKMKDYLPDGSSLFKGAAVSVSANPGVQAIGTITPREEGAKALPSVLVQSYGKGKVVYLAAGFDSAYYLYPFPYYRLLLARAMRWAAAEQPRIQVDAPMCVYSTFYRQKTQGERLVVNLFNNANTESNHAKPDEDVPLRDEILPIHDIKVAFKDYNISRIHLEPEGIDLKVTRDGNTCQVTLPPLSIHSMVVAELGQTSRRPTTTKRISRGKK
ncbi:MAG: hypothetical protein WCL39_06165, partial [Armatimonadota bacterium]